MNSFEKKQIEKIREAFAGIQEQISALDKQEVMPAVIILRKDRINYIINTVCDYYDFNAQDIFKRHRNPRQSKIKAIVIKLLHDIGDVSLGDIAELFGSRKSYHTTYGRYNNLTDDLDEGTYGNAQLKKEYKEILKKLGV